jgi:hypothetical protein
VVLVAKTGTSDKEVSAIFSSATIPNDFCCLEGRQAVAVVES